MKIVVLCVVVVCIVVYLVLEQNSAEDAGSFWDVVRGPKIMETTGPTFGEEVAALVEETTGKADKVQELVRDFVLNGDESHVISTLQNAIIELGVEAHPAMQEILSNEELGGGLFSPNAGILVKQSPFERICDILLRSNARPTGGIARIMATLRDSEIDAVRNAAMKVVAASGEPKWQSSIEETLASDRKDAVNATLDGVCIAARQNRLGDENSGRLFELIARMWPKNGDANIAEVLVALDRSAARTRLVQDDVLTSTFPRVYSILSACKASSILIPREKLHVLIGDFHGTADHPSLRLALINLARHQDASDKKIFTKFTNHPQRRVSNAAVDAMNLLSNGPW